MIKEVNIQMGPIPNGYGVMVVICHKHHPMTHVLQVTQPSTSWNRNSQQMLQLVTHAVHN
jgi:hypothetical protein